MGLKVLALVIWGLTTIVTCCGIWNAAYATKQVENLVIASSIATFVINGVAIYLCAKKVSKDYATDKAD